MAKKGFLASIFLPLAIVTVVVSVLAVLLNEEPAVTEPPVRNETVRNDTYCALVYDQIDSDLQKANYCTVASDCVPLLFEGPYIEFGCYHFVNKAVDAGAFFRRVAAYDAECDTMIDLCMPVPNATCVSGKCVA